MVTGIAALYLGAASWGNISPTEARPMVQDALRRAIGLTPSLAEVVHGVVAGLADLLRLERGGFLSLVTGWRLRGQPEARERSGQIDELAKHKEEELMKV